MKNKIQEVFATQLNLQDVDNFEKMEVIQDFPSTFYNIKNCKSVNLTRWLIFQKLFASTSVAELF